MDEGDQQPVPASAYTLPARAAPPVRLRGKTALAAHDPQLGRAGLPNFMRVGGYGSAATGTATRYVTAEITPGRPWPPERVSRSTWTGNCTPSAPSSPWPRGLVRRLRRPAPGRGLTTSSSPPQRQALPAAPSPACSRASPPPTTLLGHPAATPARWAQRPTPARTGWSTSWVVHQLPHLGLGAPGPGRLHPRQAVSVFSFHLAPIDLRQNSTCM